MSLRLCFRCGVPLKTGDEVALTIYAIYQDLKSKLHWAVEKPHDAEEETLRHRNCPISRND